MISFVQGRHLFNSCCVPATPHLCRCLLYGCCVLTNNSRQAGVLGSGFSLAPAIISHHKHGYLRGCCSTTPSPSNRQRKPKLKHTTALQPSHSRYPMYFLPKHDHLVAGLRFHSNSLFNIDVEGLTVLRQLTGRCPATPIYNQCAIDCQLDVGGGEVLSAGSKLVILSNRIK